MRLIGWAVTAIGAFALLAGLAGAAFVYSGVYNVGATKPHSQLAYWLLQTAAVQSIRRRAQDIAVPDLSSPATLARGFDLFRAHCVQCHGAPGIAPEPFALGLEPGAPPLAQAGRDWSPQELYWTVRHGIKMTAMPAWEYRLADADLWALVAFLRALPRLSPADYRHLAETHAENSAAAGAAAGDGGTDAETGRIALHQYACNMCHAIPGVSGPPAHAGPPLERLAARPFIAGGLINTPANLVRWIRHPQAVKPLTAMPDLGVSEAHARPMAAYLYAH